MKINFLEKKDQIALSLENMYNAFGYKKYNMNKFEEYSFYMENKSFLDDLRVIVFNDPNGKLMALKPDITMSIIKNCAKEQDKNHKIYYNESVFRIPKSDTEYKEIRQTGLEYVGEIDTYQTIEILNLACKSLEMLSEDYTLVLSNMGIILSVLDKMELQASQKNEVINFIKQKNMHDLERYIENNQIKNTEILLDILKINHDAKKGIKELSKIIKDNDCIKSMEQVIDALTKVQPSEKIKLDFSYIASTEYYNGLIFVGYIDGVATQTLSGGRYDKLVSKMGMENKSALGFAVDLTQTNKILADNIIDTQEIKYSENDDIEKIIKNANKMFEDGKAFNITKN